MQFKCDRSRSGLATLCEIGTGYTNTGHAQVLCGPEGERLKPLFLPKPRFDQPHAIFAIEVGYHIVSGNHDSQNTGIVVSKITKIGDESDANAVLVEDIGYFNNNELQYDKKFCDVVQAAYDKMHCYHCRDIHYVDVSEYKERTPVDKK